MSYSHTSAMLYCGYTEKSAMLYCGSVLQVEHEMAALSRELAQQASVCGE
jgi:hypothetical protein